MYILFVVNPDIFALKKTRASGRNVGKVFNPVVKLVLENQPLSVRLLVLTCTSFSEVSE